MKILVFIGLLLVPFHLVTAQVDKFQLQSDKLSTGIVYHYIKSNKDGSDPERISVYFATKDRVEVFKYHPESPASRAALVIALMDWNTFSIKKLESWTMTGTEEKALVARLEYLPAEKAASIDVPAAGRPIEKTPIHYLPFHVYNFDLTSLNFMMPHLSNPGGKFTIGIADPNFGESGPLFLYRGEAQIEFVADEDRKGISCRKYRIDGAGLENRGGFIWVDKKSLHFVDLEIDLPDNPDWKNFKLILDKTEKLSDAGWSAFYKKHFQ